MVLEDRRMNVWVSLAVFVAIGGTMGAAVSEVTDLSWIRLGARPALAQVGGDGVTEDIVNLFARVVLEIEPYRKDALEASSNTDNDSEKNEIRRQFIRQATEIIEANGMTVADYNRIAIQLRQDEDLRGEIESAIRVLQENEA